MRKVKHTTVVLSDAAQKIKIELTPVFGLKNILSAGLLLLSRLDTENQKKIIIEANKETGNISDVIELAAKLKHHVRYKIPSNEEQKALDALRQVLLDDSDVRASAEKQKRKEGRQTRKGAG